MSSSKGISTHTYLQIRVAHARPRPGQAVEISARRDVRAVDGRVAAGNLAKCNARLDAQRATEA
jgi:hypothetical protein